MLPRKSIPECYGKIAFLAYSLFYHKIAPRCDFGVNLDPFCFQKTIKIAPRRRLEPSWAHLEVFWRRLGHVSRHLGGVLGRLGAISEASWAILEASWAVLGAS